VCTRPERYGASRRFDTMPSSLSGGHGGINPPEGQAFRRRLGPVSLGAHTVCGSFAAHAAQRDRSANRWSGMSPCSVITAAMSIGLPGALHRGAHFVGRVYRVTPAYPGAPNWNHSHQVLGRPKDEARCSAAAIAIIIHLQATYDLPPE
jgi:hypothetical protein